MFGAPPFITVSSQSDFFNSGNMYGQRFELNRKHVLMKLYQFLLSDLLDFNKLSYYFLSEKANFESNSFFMQINPKPNGS